MPVVWVNTVLEDGLTLLQVLASRQLILMDGAMGTELIKSGLDAQTVSTTANLSHQNEIKKIHSSYVDAGSIVLLTNTFMVLADCANSIRSLTEVRDIARAAVCAARSQSVFVLASIGPFSYDDSRECKRKRQAVLHELLECDGLLLETLSDEKPIELLLDLLPLESPIPLFASASYCRMNGEIVTFTGLKPGIWAQRVQAYKNVSALGSNCGKDISLVDLCIIAQDYSRVSRLPIFIRPNAGTPVYEQGGWQYPPIAEQLIACIPALSAAGVCMIGGCCGTNPEMIRAIHNATYFRSQ